VDDVLKISRNIKALEEALQELDNKAHKTEVTINQEKTKYMRVRRDTISVSAQQKEGTGLKVSLSFPYVSSIINGDNSI
jgi:low affinity Fe/Cu permease